MSKEQLCSKLAGVLASQDDIGSLPSIPEDAKILGVFTGQGAQWPCMGRELLHTSNFARQRLQALEQHLQDLPGADRPQWSLTAEIMAAASVSRVHEAEISQPLCTALQIVLVDLVREAGIRFDAVVGHSSGEMGAAYAAGYLRDQDAIRIAYYRGVYSKRARSAAGKPGAMLAAATSFEDAVELCEMPELKGRLSVAAANSPASVTLSGDADAVDEAILIFEDEGKFARKLKVDTAYHSHHMLPIVDRYIEALQKCNIQPQQPADMRCCWYSSVTQQLVDPSDEGLRAKYWADNMINPVMFAQALEATVSLDIRFGLALEVGPHPALRTPALEMIKAQTGNTVLYRGLLQRGVHDVEAFTESLGFIWTHSVPQKLNFAKISDCLGSSGRGQLLKNLPSYQWDHDKVYWQESRQSRANRTRTTPIHELLGTIQPDGVDNELRWRNVLSEREIAWLGGHKIQGQTLFPAAGYISMAVEAAMVLAADREVQLLEINDLIIDKAMMFSATSIVETLFTLSLDSGKSTSADSIDARFHLSGSTGTEQDTLVTFCHGKLFARYGSCDLTALPTRGPVIVDSVKVETERFYSSLVDRGYEYSGLFKSLSDMQRNVNSGTAMIANPSSCIPNRALLVHPAMLDCAIQAMFLAYCYPGDNRLWSIHVPKSIEKIRFNTSLLKASAGLVRSFPVDAVVSNESHHGFAGDIDVFASDGTHGLIQIQGLHCVSSSPNSPSNDTNLFFETKWGVATPDGASLSTGAGSSQRDYELAVSCERITYYYLKTLQAGITPNDLDASEWHFKHFMKYAARCIATVEAGTQPLTEQSWIHDTKEQIDQDMARYVQPLVKGRLQGSL